MEDGYWKESGLAEKNLIKKGKCKRNGKVFEPKRLELNVRTNREWMIKQMGFLCCFNHQPVFDEEMSVPGEK